MPCVSVFQSCDNCFVFFIVFHCYYHSISQIRIQSLPDTTYPISFLILSMFLIYLTQTLQPAFQTFKLTHENLQVPVYSLKESFLTNINIAKKRL